MSTVSLANSQDATKQEEKEIGGSRTPSYRKIKHLRKRSSVPARSPIPSPETSISCTTFNILAPIFKRVGSEGCRESLFHEAWFNRNVNIIDLLLLKGSSIICLQEFWIGNDELVRLYEERLAYAGYLTFKLARTCDRGDGLLTAIRSDQIMVLNYRELRFNDHGDRVAQFFHLRIKVPFYRRNQVAEQQLLLVNTHLLFPHNSSFCLVRLWQVYKIIECLEHFKVEHGLASVPVILCGDWNGSKRGHVYKFLCSQGFISSYDSAHSTDEAGHQWVSHRNHRGNICGVDFIWLRNPSKHQQSLSSSWREAVLGIIMAKLCEAGISGKNLCDYIQPKDNGSKLSLHDFQKRLHQLRLTRNYSESLSGEELRDLMQTLYVDANNLIDLSAELEVVLPFTASETRLLSSLTMPAKRSANTSNVATALSNGGTSEKLAGLVVQDAFLFPPGVEQGSWPEDYVLSDHAPLTAVFKPMR